MNNLAHDLFLLMLNLAQMSSGEKIRSIFVEALNQEIEGVSFNYEDSRGDAGRSMRISTARRSFGCIVWEGDIEAAGEHVGPLVRNAVKMLAVILEKKEQEKLLSDDKFRLEAMVEDRTRELERVNLELVGEIQERMLAEQSLSEANNFVKSLIDSSPLGIIALDREGRVTMWSKGAERVFGWAEDETLGKPNPVVPPEKADDFKRRFRQTLESEVIRGIEIERVTRDGARLTLLLYTSAIRDRFGETMGAVGIFEDITLRKQMEEELARSRKIESLGVFAGGIAHDFNNILTGVHGNVQLAKLDAKPGTELHTVLEEAEKALVRATALTRQLLTFARGGQPVKKVSSLAQLVEDSIIFVLRGSRSGVCFDMAADLLPCEVDPEQISQVITNIALNADQAMPEGGQIKVRARNETLGQQDSSSLPAGAYVRIDIQDQGIGIGKDHQARIFDPYFSTKDKGSGLGLATAFSIIRRHGGLLSVESELEKGSVFSIFLPAISDVNLESEKPRPLETNLSGSVLLMDDDPAVRSVMKRMLSRLGLSVSEAADGREALWEFERSLREGHPYDLVIMDLTVPGAMGGKEAVKKLKQLYPSARAIVSSGYSNDPVLANYLEYGFDARVVKPAGIKELAEAVSLALAQG